jgi:hypothetical protein
MPERTLKFSFQKNAIYDRRGSRALSDLWGRSDPAESPCTGEEPDYGRSCQRSIRPTLADMVYLYRDLYMPQRAD